MEIIGEVNCWQRRVEPKVELQLRLLKSEPGIGSLLLRGSRRSTLYSHSMSLLFGFLDDLTMNIRMKHDDHLPRTQWL